MKTIYSVLATLALLFSLPNLAVFLTNKSIAGSANTNKKERVTIDLEPRGKNSPPCGAGGF